MIIGTTIGQTNDEALVAEATRTICELRSVFEPPTDAQISLDLQNSGKFSTFIIANAFARANVQCPLTGVGIRRMTLVQQQQQEDQQDQEDQQQQLEEKKFPWKVVGIAGGLVAVLGIIFVATRKK